MDIKRCFEQDCEFEAVYICKCASPGIYSCKQHTGKHAELPNKTHSFEFNFIETCEETKEAILGFLTKETSEHIRLKRKILASFSQLILNSEKYIKELIKNLDSSSDVISNCWLKIEEAKKISGSMQDPILELLRLQPNEAVEKLKLIVPTSSDWQESAKLFCGFSKKFANRIESLIKDNFKAHLDERVMSIESMQEDHSKTISLTNCELANVKDSISLIINESSQSLKGLENINEPKKLKKENKKNLLNFQISATVNNLDSKLKETDNDLNTLDTLRNKTAEIWSRQNNPELEMDFRATCSAYLSSSNLYDPQLTQAYQDYLNAYQQKTSLYIITWEDYRSNLNIYNTETETKEVKILETSTLIGTIITQLPNGKLFCLGSYKDPRLTALIDLRGGVKLLPSGTSSLGSSCIYFNNSVYCFGGQNDDFEFLTLSCRFDLDRNRWIQLTPIPEADCFCNSIIFNGNILISGFENRNLLLYSIDIDSFSTIPYEFEEGKRKILINAERLYLIEFYNGSIYESEIGSDTNWTRIADSPFNFNPNQLYCSYNKGAIYIGTVHQNNDYHFGDIEDDMIYECYKFDLNTKLACNLLSLSYKIYYWRFL